MKTIDVEKVQSNLDAFKNKDVYIHVETTNGAYASHFHNQSFNVGAYVRNVKVSFTEAKIVQDGVTHRVGLKTENGWIYAEGLTDWVIYEEEQLLLAGHDEDGRLMVALQISERPFDN
ncbi:MAG TPA: YojF family protein [Bacillota bacterium]|nr:YojF family protein [Bacillota bacterium]